MAGNRRVNNRGKGKNRRRRRVEEQEYGRDEVAFDDEYEDMLVAMQDSEEEEDDDVDLWLWMELHGEAQMAGDEDDDP
jgi:hypothetical protein